MAKPTIEGVIKSSSQRILRRGRGYVHFVSPAGDKYTVCTIGGVVCLFTRKEFDRAKTRVDELFEY